MVVPQDAAAFCNFSDAYLPDGLPLAVMHRASTSAVPQCQLVATAPGTNEGPTDAFVYQHWFKLVLCVTQGVQTCCVTIAHGMTAQTVCVSERAACAQRSASC